MSNTIKYKKLLKRLTDNNFDEDTQDKLLVPVIGALVTGIESMMSDEDDAEDTQENLEQDEQPEQDEDTQTEDDDDDLLSEDEQPEQDEEEQEQPAPKKRGRPAKAVVEEEDDEDIFAEAQEDEDEQEQEEEQEQPAPKKRGRKPKVVQEVEQPGPKKRGRKPKVVVEEEQEQPVQKKRGRKPKAVVDTGPNYEAMKNSELGAILEDFGGSVAKATAKATDIKSKKAALIKAIGTAQAAHAALVEKGLAKLEAAAKSKKLELKLDGRMKESKKAAAVAKILLQNGVTKI